jgi:hypothetical protein
MATKKRKATGPKPERLVIAGGWKEAVSRALKRGKPPTAKKGRKKAT